MLAERDRGIRSVYTPMSTPLECRVGCECTSSSTGWESDIGGSDRRLAELTEGPGGPPGPKTTRPPHDCSLKLPLICPTSLRARARNCTKCEWDAGGRDRRGRFNSSLAHFKNVALTRVNSQSRCRSRTPAQCMQNISGHPEDPRGHMRSEGCTRAREPGPSALRPTPSRSLAELVETTVPQALTAPGCGAPRPTSCPTPRLRTLGWGDFVTIASGKRVRIGAVNLRRRPDR